MSVETAKKLLEGGIVARADVEVALLSAVIRGVPFVQTFGAEGGEHSELLDQLMDQSGALSIRTVHARPELCQALPVGMCERLLAVPVRQESITGTVDVAAVDPFDGHVRSEFSFHLDAPVRILRAPLQEVLTALDGLRTGGAFAPSVHQMLGVALDDAPLPRPDVLERRPTAGPSSVPPIPLVQRTEHLPSTSVAPQPGVGGVASESQLVEDESGGPIIDLRRPKSESAETVTRARLQEADLVQVEKQLATSTGAEEVLELLIEHACPEGLVLAFTVKHHEYVAKAASFSTSHLREVSVKRGHPSVFQAALEHGHYLGPLPDTAVHGSLRLLLEGRGGLEVYVSPVLVSDRVTLMLLVTGFDRSFTATRRVDRVTMAAGAALERQLLERKRSR